MLPKLNSRSLPWPVDWDELFGTARPLILEIGFGQGQFLLHLASTHPDHHIVGLEISNRCLVKAETAIERRQIDNVRVIHTLAETALYHLFEPATLTQVHINFPDPWFKTRHGHRRLMQRDTLDAIVSRLVPGGMLYLATDIVEYAEMSHDLLAATPGLDNTLAAPWVGEMPGRVVTKYERKAAKEGRKCHYFVYCRNQTTAPVVPVIKELVMPHVVFESPLTLAEMRAAFSPAQHEFGESRINLNAVYEGNRSLLFDVYVKEPTIVQRVALMVIERDSREHEYTLQLSMLGHPRPTAGVHRAVNLLADMLLQMHAANRVLVSKVQNVSS